MNFWKLEAPEYKSDYDYEFINGELVHPFGLPGVNCDGCGETWGGSRILPIECPEELKKHKNIIDRWPISIDEFNNLTQKISSILKVDNAFKPGDSFQPSFLDVASKPKYDFLWSSIGSVIVSERVKKTIEEYVKGTVDFVKVIKRNIGNREPKLPAPIPKSGEPEDIIEEVELIKNTCEIQDYFEMIIKYESKEPLFTKISGTCTKCNREDIDEESRLLLMTDELWNGQKIFKMATTLYIVITDELKNKLEKIKASNVKFINITKKD